MSAEQITDFSGISGRVLRESVSFGSFVTGLVLSFIVFVGGFVATFSDTPQMLTPLMQVVMALALARFALNGMYGEWTGTLFSGKGGSWSAVLLVALRYLFLTLLWLLPLILAGFGKNTMATGFGGPMGVGPMGGGSFMLMMLYMLGMMITPPMFLIVSVRADNFADILTPAHWRGCFSGRTGDLFQIYALYAGGVGCMVALGLPIVVGVAPTNWKFALFLGSVGLAFVFGMAVTLLGRLCGFYACGDAGDVLPSRPPAGPDAFGAGSGGTVAEGAAYAPAHLGVSGSVAAAPEPVAAPRPVAVPVSAAPSGGAAPTVAAAVAVGEPPIVPVDPTKIGVKAPAPDPSQPIEAARGRFHTDREGALKMVEELRSTFPAHPKVLHALMLMRLQAGQQQAAIGEAGEALDSCVVHGEPALAGELVRALGSHLPSVTLQGERFLALGQALLEAGDHSAAAKPFALLARNEPTDAKPIKALMKIAEARMEQRSPGDAVKIYGFLLQHCATSPLAEYFKRGLERAQRSAA
jgi:hypothetical protein